MSIPFSTFCQDSTSIINAINKAISDNFRENCRHICPPYGDGRAAEKIAEKIVETLKNGKIDLKKKFYDLQ